MKIFDYQLEALNYVIPFLRTNEEIKTLLKSIGIRFDNLQNVIVYMLDSLNLRKARGVWLDYAGKEVGAKRDEIDYGDYFCVNRLHLNVPKKFYFFTSKLNPESQLSLSDAEFIQKIFAYIGANSSCGTRNEIINIVKIITNADLVHINIVAKCSLKINLIGENIILTKNTITYIQQILGNGIYLEEITINDKTN